jgi:transposase
VSDTSAGILEVKKSLQKPMLLWTWQRATDTVTMRKQDINKALQNVEALLKEDQSASPQMRAMMQLLVTIIHLLAAKLGLDSSNSSTPPSKDPNRPRGAKNKAKGVKRKPGGQHGHEGANLKKEEHPDRIETLSIDRRTIPADTYVEAGFEARQVIDMEVVKVVTEFRAEVLENPRGEQFVAQFPADVTRPVQYGGSVKTQAVYMSQQQLLPYDRVRDYFADQCGIPISAGSLFNFNQEAFDRLESFEAIVQRHLMRQELLHADETGINVNGKLLWLHSVSTDKWTLFFPHAKRGGDAVKAMGILEPFRGILCHDHWKPYFQLQCQHALCNAHHLRELEWAWEQDGQEWALKMQELFLDMRHDVEKAGGSVTEEEAQSFRRRYRAILARADEECPPPDPKTHSGRGRVARSKSRNLLERLRDFEVETLRFLTDSRVPFTNNQSENDIRMTKVQQKISGCFRSFEGARIFCRVRSYLSTCNKHGVAPTEALASLFSGTLPNFIASLQ